MKVFTAALLLLAVLVTGQTFHSHGRFVQSNGTHFLDPHHTEPIRHFGCKVSKEHASLDFMNEVKKLHKEHLSTSSYLATRALQRKKPRKVSPPIHVSVYFHIISSSAAEGSITQEMADLQLAELNRAYNPHAITFTLKHTTFTTNDAWAVAATPDMEAAKTSLRRGSYAALNLYFHTDFHGSNLGTCTLPSRVPPALLHDPTVYASDGCNINANTMPGGSMQGYNQGKTAVHETGHWFGLLHPFEGYSCDSEGDLIADTPAESESTDGCPAKPAKDSCPASAGVDPIHNYMDYSTDACYESFTPLQVERMGRLWGEFRA